MTITKTKEESGSNQYKVIGTRAPRLDGLDKVTGSAKFGSDISLPGMLHGKMLTSPHAHARILSINTAKAESIPGVKAVITASDFPIFETQKDIDFFAEQFRGARIMAEPFMAREKVLYGGHPIAAVAAVDPHVAEEAAKLIEVEYEILPAVLTIEDALKDGAPLVHDKLTTVLRDRPNGKEDSGTRSNVAGHGQLRRGDIEKGFKEGDTCIYVEKKIAK